MTTSILGVLPLALVKLPGAQVFLLPQVSLGPKSRLVSRASLACANLACANLAWPPKSLLAKSLLAKSLLAEQHPHAG